LKPLYALLDATVITIKDGRTPNLITMSHNAGVPKELRKRLERLIGPSAPTAAGTHLASHYWSSITGIIMVPASRKREQQRTNR
jgi:hypothetical protein